MNRELLVAVLAAQLLLPRLARGDPCDRAIGLDLGTLAPCSGVLVPQPYALDCLRCRTVDVPRMRAEHAYALDTCAVERLDLEARLEAMATLAQVRSETIAKLAAPPSRVWPWVAAIGGVAFGALVTWGVMR